MIDHQYYTYFQSHISVLVFGFIDDDTTAVLKSMWTDHPVIIITVVMVFQILLVRMMVFRIWEKAKLPDLIVKSSTIMKWLFVFLFFLLFAYGGRGNFTQVFPLKTEDAVISENSFINKIPLNGVTTFFEATKDYLDTKQRKTKKEVLSEYGYESVNEALADYFNTDEAEFKNQVNKKNLFKLTSSDSTPDNKRYNVVFILMESFGGYYLNFHSKELNLLGEFENHYYNDCHFENFLSSTRGTIFSLESILLNTRGWPALSNSSMRFNS